MKKKPIIIILSVIILVAIGFAFNKNNDKSNEIAKVIKNISLNKDLKIIIATDIHYLDKSLTDDGIAFQTFIDSGDGKELKYIEEITDAFLEDVISEKPDILILTGDLTTNGEKLSHESLGKKLKKIKDRGIFVYVIPGNHDVNNPYARKFLKDKQAYTEYISPEDFKNIYSFFGYSDAIKTDENSLSYFSSPNGETFFLMLDTCKYNNNIVMNSPETGGEISEKTFEWIKGCMNYAKKMNGKVLVFMHHNLMDHSEVVKKGYTLNNSKEVIKLFLDNDVKATFSGHIHIQNIEAYTKNNKKIYDIVTGALSVYPQKYGALEIVSKNETLNYTTKWVDMEEYAKENNIKDENLLNFKTYSKKHFTEKFKANFSKALYSEEILNEQEKEDILNFASMINLKYFEGTVNKRSEGYSLEEVINSTEYKNIQKLSMGFIKEYINSILKDTGIDSNYLTILLK